MNRPLTAYRTNSPMDLKNSLFVGIEAFAFVASVYSTIVFALWLSNEKSADVSTTALFTNEILGTRKNVEMDAISASISSTLCPSESTTCINTNIHGLQKYTPNEMKIKQGLFASWISSCKPPIFFILSLGFFGQMFFITYQDDKRIEFGINWKFMYAVYYLILHASIFIMIAISIWTRTNVYSQLALLFPLLFVYVSNVVNNLRNISSSFGDAAGSDSNLSKRYLQDISAFNAASFSCMFLFLIFTFNAHLYMTTDDITQSFAYFLTSQLILNIVLHIELKSTDLELKSKKIMIYVLLIVSLFLLVFSWINVYDRVVVLENNKKHMDYNSKSYHVPIIVIFFVFHAVSTILNMIMIGMGKIEVIILCFFVVI